MDKVNQAGKRVLAAKAAARRMIDDHDELDLKVLTGATVHFDKNENALVYIIMKVPKRLVDLELEGEEVPEA